MKSSRFFNLCHPWGVLHAALLGVLVTLPCHGQTEEEKPFTGQTNKDVPSDFHKYYGQRVNSWRDTERQIAKLDIDADMNQDGNLSNTDPADGGAFEATPPGVILGVGEMTRVVVRLLPYRVDFDGEVVVTLEAEGINRASRTGEFASFEDELANMGHIRVWRDKTKKILVLDSHDPAKRVVEFTTRYKTYPYNLPIAVPRFFYVEGVTPSPKYSGDIRLLVTVSHRSLQSQLANEAANGPVAPVGPGVEAANGPQGGVAKPVTFAKAPVAVAPQVSDKLGVKSFRTSFDHVLFTVQKDPVPKQFINDNNQGVWVAPPGKPYSY